MMDLIFLKLSYQFSYEAPSFRISTFRFKIHLKTNIPHYSDLFFDQPLVIADHFECRGEAQDIQIRNSLRFSKEDLICKNLVIYPMSFIVLRLISMKFVTKLEGTQFIKTG
jgi:hypothetical protein